MDSIRQANLSPFGEIPYLEGCVNLQYNYFLGGRGGAEIRDQFSVLDLDRLIINP